MCSLKLPEIPQGPATPELAANLARSVADIALVVDAAGDILDVAIGNESLAEEVNGDWVGRPWSETVTADSRPRLQSLLRELATGQGTEWRQVVHRTTLGRDIPVQYRAVRLTDDGRVLLIGRELRAVESLQRQLVDAQQALERDYWRYRRMETRYRLLFQSVSDAVIVVDAGLRKIVEANPAAASLFGGERGSETVRLVGLRFPDGLPRGFDEPGRLAVGALIERVLASGRPDSVHVDRESAEGVLAVSVSTLRQDQSSLLVVRLRPLAEGAEGVIREDEAHLLAAAGVAPDGIVVTGRDGEVLAANRAFLEQTQIPNLQPLAGESLDRWLGRGGTDLGVLMGTLRQHGTLRLFRTTLRGQLGSELEVELNAAAIERIESACFAFFIRDVGRRLGAERPVDADLPVWVDRLTERVGSAPLKDLVRESTDMIERLCIEAALRLSGGNRASAAELLGLSRQSLYVKLGRFGIGGPESNEASHEPSGDAD
jgi:transcriptional regulator PpsR